MAEIDEILLRLDAGEAVRTMKDLRDRIATLKKELDGLTIGSEKYNKALKYLVEDENSLKAAMKGTSDSMAAMTRESTRLRTSYDNYRDALADARKKQQEYNLTEEDTLRLARLTVQMNSSAEGSYNRLSKQYSILKIQLNGMSEAMRLNTDKGQTMERQAYEIYQKMIMLQEATGKHTLSVGNYGKALNGLNLATAQVVRELPSLAISANTFFLAISNNIPILVDQINQLRQVNAAAAAKGEKGVSVIKSLGKALISWNTLLTVAITIVTMFGDKIIDFIAGMFKAKEAVDVNAEALKEYKKAVDESLKSEAEATVTSRLLYDVATDTTRSMEDRLSAVHQLQDEYPDYFGNISDEAILTGQAKKSYDKLTQSLVENARAKDYLNSITEQQGKIVEAKIKRGDIQKQIEEEKKTIESLTEGLDPSRIHSSTNLKAAYRIGAIDAAENRLKELKKELEENQKNIDIAEKTIKDLTKKIPVDYVTDTENGGGTGVEETAMRELEFIRRAEDERIALIENELDRELELNRVKYERQIEDLERLYATETDITERGREEILRIISYLVERQERNKLNIILDYNEKIQDAESELYSELQQDAADFASRNISEYERERKALEQEEKRKAKIRRQGEKNVLKGIDSEEESAIAQAKAEMPVDSQYSSVRIQQEMDLAERIYQIQQESDRKRLEQMKKFQQDAINDGDTETWLDYKQKIADTEEEIEARKNEHIAEQDEEAAKKRKATTQDMLNTMQGLADGTSSILSTIADMYEEDAENSEEAAKKVKALRIASATIETISGAIGAFMQASSTIPPPAGQIVGAVQAAAVLATGLAQIQKIRNTEIDKDGSTGGSISASVDAPALTPQVNEVRNITSASEEDRLNRMASDQRVYILSSDIEASQRQRQVQVKETTF